MKRWIALAGAAVSGFVLGWFTDWSPSATVWGDVGTVAGALGTLLVLAFTARIANRERQDRLRAEKKADGLHAAAEKSAADREAEQLLRERRLQASKVSWWTTFAPDADTVLGRKTISEPVDVVHIYHWTREADEQPDDWANRGHPEVHSSEIYVHIANLSEAPIHSCVVVCEYHAAWPRGSRWIGAIPPHRTRAYADAVKGGHTPLEEHSIFGDVSNGAPVSYVEFVDDSGVVWRRHQDGRLDEVKKEPENVRHYAWS